jgi:hypothetical protein
MMIVWDERGDGTNYSDLVADTGFEPVTSFLSSNAVGCPRWPEPLRCQEIGPSVCVGVHRRLRPLTRRLTRSGPRRAVVLVVAPDHLIAQNTVKASLTLAIPSAVDPPYGERAASWPSSTPHRLTARTASARLRLGRWRAGGIGGRPSRSLSAPPEASNRAGKNWRRPPPVRALGQPQGAATAPAQPKAERGAVASAPCIARPERHGWPH